MRTFLQRWRAGSLADKTQFLLCWAGIILGGLVIIFALLSMEPKTVALLAAGGLMLGSALYWGLR